MTAARASVMVLHMRYRIEYRDGTESDVLADGFKIHPEGLVFFNTTERPSRSYQAKKGDKVTVETNDQFVATYNVSRVYPA